MLDTMSKILGFSIEEKQMLGLIKKATVSDDNGQESASNSAL